MPKRLFAQRFLSTLQVLKYQCNITSKETLELENFNTSDNKNFKLKLKVVMLTSVTSINKTDT